ncbi:Hexokinase isoenzyme 2 [Didymella glomerata]|jgi:hexokinase|uniref:Phosphotransferase n=1 Tax=Didymella glomerata TaxID=749621 RepID=A0A9W8X5I5_9PLEO|nr:Hexokinase isoenzyme 2 [Didymella glomerata]
MASSAQQHVGEEAYSSRQQRSELKKMADLPSELEKELDLLDEQFWISGDKLKQIVQRFHEELDEGLAKHHQNIAMHQTWVHHLPSGNERGTFLTLDLGGTNLRVCEITLHGHEKEGKEKTQLNQKQYKLPEELKKGDADALWNFIAEELEDFVKQKGLMNNFSKQRPMPLGFTFSYPATQARIDHAILKTWTKGFDISGVEDHDVAQQLRSKIEERNLPIELICVINDTVGAMIASAYNDPKTIVGAIFGTGCNAAYMANLSSIGKMKDSDREYCSKISDKMAINCEYGAFDNAHRVLPWTKFDKQIDVDSPRPGEQAFEKLSAGLYLGEIYRLIVLDLVERGLVFKNQDTKKLEEPYSIDTGFLSQIEDDESPSFSKSRDLFSSLLDLKPSDVEIELSRHIAEMIAVRGARLCACGVAAICLKEGIEEGHVAADGSVANKHPKFKRRWANALGEILGWNEEDKREGEGPIKITSAEDGSGIGCAIIAAMELEKRSKV